MVERLPYVIHMTNSEDLKSPGDDICLLNPSDIVMHYVVYKTKDKNKGLIVELDNIVNERLVFQMYLFNR